MTPRAAVVGAACALALASGGCGASGSSGGAGPNPNDKRAVALACIRDEQRLPARLTGRKSIQVDGDGGARVEFFLTGGEAEGMQFQGDAQGAEQIGSALLFVNRASDDQLKKIEDCLEKQ